MKTPIASRATRTIDWIKELWAEFDYAQRRLLEVRLGVPVLPSEPPKIAVSIDELETLYELKTRD